MERPEWQVIPAVKQRRVILAPNQPFGALDLPPSVNRLIGLTLLLHKLYPDKVSSDLRRDLREFYRLFYQVEISDADLQRFIDALGN
jgi:iron complex transport system substrate-binding protein